MSLSETRKAIRELPNNLIYVDTAGSVQAADLKELEAAFVRLENASRHFLSFECVKEGAAGSTASAVSFTNLYHIVQESIASREDPDSAEARAASPAKGLSESGS